MMEDANDIQEALGRSYGTPDIDEDDLEAGQENTVVLLTHLNEYSTLCGYYGDDWCCCPLLKLQYS